MAVYHFEESEQFLKIIMASMRIELTRDFCSHRILSPGCLPVPPQRHKYQHLPKIHGNQYFFTGALYVSMTVLKQTRMEHCESYNKY